PGLVNSRSAIGAPEETWSSARPPHVPPHPGRFGSGHSLPGPWPKRSVPFPSRKPTPVRRRAAAFLAVVPAPSPLGEESTIQRPPPAGPERADDGWMAPSPASASRRARGPAWDRWRHPFPRIVADYTRVFYSSANIVLRDSDQRL